MSEHGLRLIIGGRNYSGWKKTSVFRSMQNIAGKYSLEFTDMVIGKDKLPLIQVNDPCKISILSEATQEFVQVMNGYVDKMKPSVTNKSIQYAISGRDKSGDLVDCSVVDQAEIKGLKFEAFVQLVVAPFKIKVFVQAGLDTGDPIKSATYDQGDTVHEFITKYAQLKQLLIYPDTNGNLIISRVNKSVSAHQFILGGPDANIVKWSASVDGTKVFNRYVTKGSKKVEPGETEAQSVHLKGETLDERVPRHRPLLILPDKSVNRVSVQDVADWEATNRRANSQAHTVTINGWLPIFNIVALLHIKPIGFKQNMLISSYNLSFDNSGKTTELTFVHPESFTPLPKGKITGDDKDSPLSALGQAIQDL